MTTYYLTEGTLDRYYQPVMDNIRTRTEFEFLKLLVDRYPQGNDLYKVVDYVLDSYNKQKIVMDEHTAHINSMIDGIEYLILTHYNTKGEDE